MRWRVHARTMLAAVAAHGVTVDAGWASAFLDVPRHVFVPRFYVDGRQRLGREVTEGDEGWLATAYADEALVTRRERVPRPGGGYEYVATSSSSQPTIIAVMLDRLAVAADSRVLEIGTGTGYNAALMCHRLGDERVTSIDLDPDLIALAGERLAVAGFHPRLTAGDGAAGVPEAAPYDRIIATCAVDAIPSAWIEQSTEGARIVAPMVEGGALVVLTKTGGRVEGRVDPESAFFMPLRTPDGRLTADRRHFFDDPPEQTDVPADLDPGAFGDLDFRLWLGVAMGGVQFMWRPDGPPMPAGPGGEPVDPAELSRQWHAYVAAGRPERTRFGLTATVDGGWMWLDAPDSRWRWDLPL